MASTKKPSGIKIIHAALDEGPNGELVLRGVIDPGSLADLKIDTYQREELSPRTIARLKEAMRTGSVPDIDLGMRGLHTTDADGGTTYYLQDDTYIVDGQQRRAAALALLAEEGDVKPRLGATIHFNTTRPWERTRFDALNLNQVRLSPNVTLRNYADDYVVARSLLQLATNDKDFVLRNKVSWSQGMRRGELITARTLFMTAGALHRHAGPGLNRSVEELTKGLQKIYDNVGRNTFRQNIRLFFEIVDSCFGVRQVAYVQGAVQLKMTFLMALTRVFSDHPIFWKGDQLVVTADVIRKLGQFPVFDPSVKDLAGSGGKAADVLFDLMVSHINSGKRSRRLVPRSRAEECSVEATVEAMENDDE